MIGLGVCVIGLLGCFSFDSGGTGEAALSDHAVRRTFQRLHQPVYDIYGLGFDRDAIHSHLAASFSGEALTHEYVEHFTALARMRDESTAIQVLRVDYESIHVLHRTAAWIRLDADWSVGGIVTHQSHRHPRTNRYRAVFDMAYGSQGWRLIGSNLRDMNRVRGFSSLTGGEQWPLDNLPKTGSGMMSPLDLLKGGMAEDIEELRRRRSETPAGPKNAQKGETS